MKAENDFTPVIRTAIKEVGVESPEKAEAYIDAFLQWASLIPFIEDGVRLQMLHSVDRAWHAFILNTQFYREFCDKYFGFYLDHDPLDSEDDSLPKDEYAEATLAALLSAFGSSLNPFLMLLSDERTCCMGCKKKVHVVSVEGALAA